MHNLTGNFAGVAMSYELEIIDYRSPMYKQVLQLRNEVLRIPLGLHLEEQDTYEDKDQFITIAHHENQIMGCLMIKPLSQTVAKLRQMAVYPEHQGKGLGSTMLYYTENFCLMNGYKVCELHARKEAIPFYIKNNYFEIGTEFYEVGILHKKMIKNLEPFIL
ncbi:MAG: GNAT family N-acetyltransferase [Chitinophagaceae bacterium]|nr:GNAT family N-acetyltransferase [Chitinophagaceae bacterium]